jgi:hypothetical protein
VKATSTVVWQLTAYYHSFIVHMHYSLPVI